MSFTFFFYYNEILNSIFRLDSQWKYNITRLSGREIHGLCTCVSISCQIGGLMFHMSNHFHGGWKKSITEIRQLKWRYEVLSETGNSTTVFIGSVQCGRSMKALLENIRKEQIMPMCRFNRSTGWRWLPFAAVQNNSVKPSLQKLALQWRVFIVRECNLARKFAHNCQRPDINLRRQYQAPGPAPLHICVHDSIIHMPAEALHSGHVLLESGRAFSEA
jgi:hypothetical protein